MSTGRIPSLRPKTSALLGIALLCTSILAGLFFLVFVEGLAYRYWPDHSKVPADGRPHVVHTLPDQRFIMWTAPIEGLKNPCTFKDLASGRRITVTPTREKGGRANGSIGPLYPWREGVAASTRTSVRCDSSFEYVDVYVTPPPAPIWLDPFGPWAYVIHGPAVFGVGLIIAGAVSAIRGRAGRRRSA